MSFCYDSTQYPNGRLHRGIRSRYSLSQQTSTLLAGAEQPLMSTPADGPQLRTARSGIGQFQFKACAGMR